VPRKKLDIDNLLTSPKARSSKLLQTESKATQEYQRAAKVTHSKLKGASDLAVRALIDMKAFAELISFQGGWNNFGECHGELVDFVSFPQTNEAAQQKLAYEGDWLAGGLRRLILMSRGHLKALEDNQPVLTPGGWVKHGNLKPGDLVIGSDGQPTKVTHVHPSSVMSLYKVTTRDGREVLCNGEHLWQVTIPSNSHKPVVKSTNELLKLYKKPRLDKRTGKERTEYRAFINTVAFRGTHADIPIDPYTLGAWLGAGTSANGGFTTADPEICSYFPFTVRKQKGEYGYGILGLCKLLRLNGLQNNKHIPDVYFLSSYEQRLELLRGLMDTDGTCHVDGNIAYFSQSNYEFISQVDKLVKSLGGVSNICAYDTTCNGKKFPTWSLSIKLADCPFKLKRKAAQWKGIKGQLRTAIVDIRPVESASARCITVDNPDGIYLTSDYLPTHNSTIGTILYVLWRIYRNPNIRILVACNLQSLAYSFIRELRTYFENQDLEVIWNKRPHIDGSLLPRLQAKNRDRNFQGNTEAEDRKVIWNNVALQVVRPGRYKEPTVYATSVGTTVTGQHYDLVILDDLIDFKNIESETKKQAVEEWIADIESVLNPPELTAIVGKDGFSLPETLGGELVITGTRYAVDDYYGQVLEKQESMQFNVFVRNIYKNGKDNTDGYLWHEKRNARWEDNMRATTPPRRFASQYLNQVYEKDHALLNTAAITVLPDDTVFTNAGRCCVRLPNGRTEVINSIIAVDPAFSSSKTGDDCAILIGGKLSDGRLVLIDAAVDRMEAATVVKKVVEFAGRWSTLRVFYEQNGVGMLVPELFKTDAALVDGKKIICYGHYEQRQKESKIQGVLELPVNSGKLLVTQSIRNNGYLWKQLTNYPAVRHDDFLDGLVTLWEQSLPSREQYNHNVSGVNYDPYRLNIESLMHKNVEPDKSYLQEYSNYYG
jgi:predicted phage terminase large subunit-like protein